MHAFYMHTLNFILLQTMHIMPLYCYVHDSEHWPDDISYSCSQINEYTSRLILILQQPA